MTWRISEPIHPAPGLDARGTALADGRVLVTAGSSAVGACAILDPATLRWSPASAPPTPRHGLVTLADGRVLAVGGGSDYRAVARCDLFDPQTGAWHPAPPLSVARRDVTCVVLGDRVLAIGGQLERDSRSAAVEAWTPGAPAWITLPPIPDWPVASRTYTACALADGTLFATSGYRAWHLDPATDAWREVGTQLIQDRPALVAFEGGVAMLGGEITPVGARDTTRTWSATAAWRDGIALPQRRAGCGAVVLDDGRIAILGGYEIETTEHRRELTGGELDFEYRCETSQSIAWRHLDTALVGTPAAGWESIAAPLLGGVHVLRVPGAIAAIRQNGSVGVWRR